MQCQLARIILFSADVQRLAQFYQDMLGLPVIRTEQGWVELNAGGCSLAIHAGASKPGNRPPKLSFYAADVAAARASLIRKGVATLGPIKSAGTFNMCDGQDPDGNPIQISSRR
ncbi:VOC family protein [Novosphingobium terrae]|uniref:VOC family protein n=1 Tax=Novosphingobium terrae TaxID=2726189 RepID=UPI00197FD840|nr:VOC family protein [Novosphingobium terrae]